MRSRGELILQAALRESDAAAADGSADEGASREPREEPSAWVGRDLELSRLRAMLGLAASGRGGSVLIEGGPGLGRSRLLSRAEQEARQAGFEVYHAAADELDARFPLHTLRECLASGGGGDPLDPVRDDGEGGTAAAAEAALSAVRRMCADAPAVLAVDDLQRADEATILAWRRIADAAVGLPLLLIATSWPRVGGHDPLAPLRPEPVDAEPFDAGPVGTVPIDPVPVDPVPVDPVPVDPVPAESGSTVVLRLEPLAPDEADLLVRALIGAPPGSGLLLLARLAGGHPGYLSALVDALRTEGLVERSDTIADVPAGTGIPSSAVAALAHRFALLLPGLLGPLRLAALLGSSFAAADLAALLDRDVAGLSQLLDDAAQLGILNGAHPQNGASPGFRSPIAREALYAGIPATLRPTLHRRAARLLAEGGAAVETVADHLMRAGEVFAGWEVDWLADNARPLVLGVPVAGLELLRRAVDRAPDSHPGLGALWEGVGAAALLRGRPDAVETLRQARAQVTDPERRATADAMLVLACLRRGGHDEALDLISQAIDDYGLPKEGLDPASARRWAARFLGLRARVLCDRGRYAEAEQDAGDALEQAGLIADQVAAEYAHCAIARLRSVQRDYEGALAAIDSELRLTPAIPWPIAEAELDPAADRIVLLAELDRDGEARAELERARESARRAHAVPRLAVLGAAAAELDYAAGRWDQALAQIAEFGGGGTSRGSAAGPDNPPADEPHDAASGAAVPGGTASRSAGPADEMRGIASWLPIRFAGLTALILARRGLDDEADAVLERWAGATIPAGLVRAKSGFLLTARALRAELTGRPDEALDLYASVLDPQAAQDFEHRHHWLPDIVRLALALGDDALAREALAAADAEAALAPNAEARKAAAQRCRGLIECDPAPLEAALDYYRRVGRPLGVAHTLEGIAAVAAQRSDLEGARAYLNQAVDAYKALDAEGDIARADIRLRALGVRRGRRGAPREADGRWASLSPMEVKVAGFVAKGLSNPEIAAALSLSPRTVQTHVSHILSKLGYASRNEIAHEAAVRLAGGAAGGASGT
jgi:DNA-binding CsgD family transcriptional regulator